MSFATIADFEAALRDLSVPDAPALAAARARQGHLTKPAGSLGRLEDIAVFLAGWQGREIPVLARCRAVVFAGNHGVTTQGVSAFPAEVTAQMVANFAAGGAAINALSAAAGLDLHVVPLDLDRPTADFTADAAMTGAECLAALNAGAAMVEPGLDLFVPGEMGIGNTTAAAALCARALGGDVADWVGPGTGLDRAGIERKIAVIEAALAFHAGAPATPFETLRRLGGREIAAMAGAVVRARQLRVPVVLDGFICCAAIAPIAAVHPGILDHCLAGHCSAEPGHVRLLDRFGLVPLLNLGMRLGEASGAVVAVQIVRCAVATHAQMATFAQAGVAGGA
ncbi:nicotinate-nucleotide--dimethylbenzimidazole phosphoribosyltransferase [Novosphingobium sp.]|uniref:nicotinate-nucleotide--dimethylbenzimidazole phosphoribosyltransferase n=1 Tax=Novosphingobium sp. TaxID=1874826 RepID=UPI003B52E7E4